MTPELVAVSVLSVPALAWLAKREVSSLDRRIQALEHLSLTSQVSLAQHTELISGLRSHLDRIEALVVRVSEHMTVMCPLKRSQTDDS